MSTICRIEIKEIFYMKPFLKEYSVTITTLSPVYIGSGETINKQEYLYDRKNNTVYIMDIRKMFSGLNELGYISQYEEFILDDTRTDLMKFFSEDIRIKPEHYSKWITEKLAVGDESRDEKSTLEINTFMKNPYGEAYVPGSSLKGAIRTVLIGDYFLKAENKTNSQEYERKIKEKLKNEENNSNSLMKDLNKDLAVSVLNKMVFPGTEKKKNKIGDIVNDTMRGLVISDSEPIDNRNLCLCQKIDWDNAGKTHSINILRECIAPSTELKFKITIDSEIFRWTIDDIISAINKVFKNVYEPFISRFASAPEINGISGNRNILFLGGGTGFVHKTEIYSLMPFDEAVNATKDILSKTTGKDLHADDDLKGVSPHILKCTYYNGKYYQMGACEITSKVENI